MANDRGKFIVIEGTDGSGKTAQFERLILALPEGTKLGTLDFPRYGEPSSFFVQKYLSGRYGGDVGSYTASVFYAVDRFDARLKTLQWIEEERRIVIANRYVASNMAHQGAKLVSKSEREKFYRWVYSLEYEIFALPKPDMNILLHVPAAIAGDLVSRRGGRHDLHEADPEHEKRAEEAYLEIAVLFPDDFHVIECAPAGTLLSPEAIHQKVWAAVAPLLQR